MDLQTNIYNIELLHQFDIEYTKNFINLLKNELGVLVKENPNSSSIKVAEKVTERIEWIKSIILVLEDGMSSRIEVVNRLDAACRKASGLLNDAEMKVFLTHISGKKTSQQIADEVGYTEGYVRILRHQINKKLGIKAVKF